MLTTPEVLLLNAGINPRPNDPPSLSAVPEAPDVGVLRRLGAQTRLIHGKNVAGSVLLRPGGSDAGTVTLRNQSPQSFKAYALQQGGYVRLTGGQYIKIGSANIDIAESHFLAVLVRIDKSSYIEGYTGKTNVIRTTQQTSSRYNRQIAISGSLGSDPSSVANRLHSLLAEGFDASDVAQTRRISTDYSSSYNLPTFGGTTTYPCAYGYDSGVNESPDNDWCWVFVRGSATGETETSFNSLMASNTSHAAQLLTIGHMWHPRHGIAIPSPMLSQTIVSPPSTNINITTNTTAGVIRATPTFASQDWVLGDATNTIDIACVIHLSRFTTLLDSVLMMQGVHPADMGLSPLSSDFVCHLGSKAQGEASSGFTLTETGTPTYNTSGGPTLLRKLGSVSTAASRTDVVTAGAVA